MLVFNEKISTITFFFTISIVTITIDQVIKHKIRQIGGFYACNQGISFGILPSSLFFWIILLFFLLLSFFYLKNLPKNYFNKPFFLFSLALLLGGAASNITDRLFFGCVLDFISINLLNFPLFNLADIAISLGSFLIILSHNQKSNS